MLGSALVAGLGMATVIVGLPGMASAAPGGDVTANVNVGSTISMTGLPASFTMTGNAGDSVATGASPVTMTVTTNNTTGYQVAVLAGAAILAPHIGANPDSIPIAALKVRETGTIPYSSSTNVAPGVVVHSQATRSLEAGDALSNDYSMLIPFVNTDTYSVTLTYLATTL